MNARLPADALRALEPLSADGLAVVEGEIAHRRLRPTVHAFAYPGFCLRIPLSRVGELPARGIPLGPRGAISFDPRDHGPRDGSPLEPWARALFAREGVEAGGEIVLYAFPRMRGYVFNPVSFWLAHDLAGDVRAVLVAVNNTFGEHHDYLLAHEDGRPIAAGETLAARKVFHVSPFCEVKGRYAFRFAFGERWLARIDYFDVDGAPPLLETWISGRARALDAGVARALPRRYRAFTLGVIARIHWQALKLWLKRVPFFTKPVPPAEALTR